MSGFSHYGGSVGLQAHETPLTAAASAAVERARWRFARPARHNIKMPPRLRFAPSPTGYLHVGGARTALFNWLYARHTGGTLILRIEDTDFERSTQEMVEGILVGMRWLGLDWDDGPYHQSHRLDLYRATAEKLIASGHAYYCFCTKDQLEQRRSAAQAAGRPPMYERTCRRIANEEAARRRAAGERCAIRFAVPESGATAWDDAVFSRLEFANPEIEDFVLLRSDGVPTYHLSVVADDLDLRITHVLRGADHISNTPKQILLYAALNSAAPIFAHVPLILGPDKTRLSKRHGATSVMAYRDEGIVPEAFRNFLALLGWTPPDSSRELPDRYASLDGADRPPSAAQFTQQSAEQVLRALAEEKQMKAGALINGARVALTGQAVAPSLFEVMLALGRDRTIARLLAAPKL